MAALVATCLALAIALAVMLGAAWYVIAIGVLVLAIVGMIVWFSQISFFG